MPNLTICNNCAGAIIRPLHEHCNRNGLTFCSPECADAYFAPDNPDPGPVGLARDLGLDSCD